MAEDLLMQLPPEGSLRRIYIRCCKSNSGGREDAAAGSRGALRHHQSAPRDGVSHPSHFTFPWLSLPLERRDEPWGSTVWEAEGMSESFAACKGRSGVTQGR